MKNFLKKNASDDRVRGIGSDRLACVHTYAC